MFVALEIDRRRLSDGVIGSLRAVFAKPNVYVEAVSLFGARYAIVRAEDLGKGIDWDLVESTCGHFSEKVLLPQGITPPQACKIKNPELKNFDTMVMIHTACEIIATTKMPMYRRTLGLIDYEAEHSEIMYGLLKHFTSIHVVTHNASGYEVQADRIMRELGAPVLVSENLSSLRGCVLALSPSQAPITAESGIDCPVITAKPAAHDSRADLITGLRVSPGPHVLEAIPDGIDPHFFAGALYEFCGFNSSGFVAQKMLYNYKVSTMPEVARAVMQNAGLNPVTLISI